MDGLKLFVVGERPRVDNAPWDELSPWALVVAHDDAEANELAKEYCGEIMEIPFDKAKIIWTDHGRDFEGVGEWQ